ncbi:APC family permease [Halalkalibacter flavus]|uniref:APC family permease n=1 Tax=Halalkalibacter flavus TaxID=3090668 RepID=UPI002FCAFCC6
MMKEGTELKRTLTLFQVVMLGLAWNTPMIYFSVFGVAYEGSSGFLTPAYAVAVLAVLFTGASYAVMAKKLPISGSAYTFVKKTMNPKLGFIVGWVLLLNYLFAPIIACITFGIFLHAQFPSIPPYVWIIGLTVMLAVITILGVNSSANISSIFVMLQIIFIIVFSIFMIHGLLNGAGTGTILSVQPFLESEMSLSIVLAGASIVIFSFLGFDTMTTLSEETINPKKTIPKAIFIMIAIVGVLHLVTSYFIQLIVPNFTFQNPDSAALELVSVVGGSLLSSFFITVLIAAIFTQGLASVTAVSRLLFVMGRDSILPNKFFGYVHPKYKTPVLNILFSSVVALLSIFITIDAALRFVNFGALTAFFFVNLCVITLYFSNKQKEEERTLKSKVVNLINPLIGAAFIAWLLFLLDLPTLIGGFVWVAVGLLYLGYLTKGFQRHLPESDGSENVIIPTGTDDKKVV